MLFVVVVVVVVVVEPRRRADLIYPSRSLSFSPCCRS